MLLSSYSSRMRAARNESHSRVQDSPHRLAHLSSLSQSPHRVNGGLQITKKGLSTRLGGPNRFNTLNTSYEMGSGQTSPRCSPPSSPYGRHNGSGKEALLNDDLDFANRRSEEEGRVLFCHNSMHSPGMSPIQPQGVCTRPIVDCSAGSLLSSQFVSGHDSPVKAFLRDVSREVGEEQTRLTTMGSVHPPNDMDVKDDFTPQGASHLTTIHKTLLRHPSGSPFCTRHAKGPRKQLRDAECISEKSEFEDVAPDSVTDVVAPPCTTALPTSRHLVAIPSHFEAEVCVVERSKSDGVVTFLGAPQSSGDCDVQTELENRGRKVSQTVPRLCQVEHLPAFSQKMPSEASPRGFCESESAAQKISELLLQTKCVVIPLWPEQAYCRVIVTGLASPM